MCTWVFDKLGRRYESSRHVANRYVCVLSDRKGFTNSGGVTSACSLHLRRNGGTRRGEDLGMRYVREHTSLPERSEERTSLSRSMAKGVRYAENICSNVEKRIAPIVIKSGSIHHENKDENSHAIGA